MVVAAGALGFVLAAALGSLADYVVPVVDFDPNSSHIQGTAFLVSPDLAMTAAHVVETVGTSAAIRCGGTRVAGVVVKSSTKYDLALIRLEWPCLKVPVVKLAPEEPGEGAKAFAVGYPGGMRLTTAGVVSLLDFLDLKDGLRWVLVVDLKIYPGNSGGPAFSEKGLLIGVITGRVCFAARQGQPGECYGTATPVSSIRLFLERNE